MDIEHWRHILEEVYGGRRWILAMPVLAGMRYDVEQLAKLGADESMCIAASRGTGEVPDEELCPEQIVLGVTGGSMMDSIRASLDALADLPDEAVARVDGFDPQGQSRVLGTIFDDGRPVAGRAKFGRRPDAWQRLEDKTIIDAVWDRIGVARVDSEVVAVERDALVAAADRLDFGTGTVWVGDSRDGFHGGGEYARWVRTEEQADEAVGMLTERCDTARVMPFLEGIPCSIHGIVFADYTIALRPCEMLVYRQPNSSRFRYARAATFWDPMPPDRDRMRQMARRVGDYLRDALDYRGAFTIDGVMTVDGFRPTELNPRFGAALGVIAGGLDISLYLLNQALVEGVDADWQPAELEQLLVDHADSNRGGSASTVVDRVVDQTKRADLVWVAADATFRRSKAGDPVDAQALLGPNATGGYLSIRLVPERTPTGRSIAPLAAAAVGWADRTWELGIGTLIPAREVR